MPRTEGSRSRPGHAVHAQAVLALAVLALTCLPAGVGAAAGRTAVGAEVTLPAPPPTTQDPLLLDAVGALPDRLKTTKVPGGASNAELLQVRLGAGGAVQGVRLTQRIELTGEGDYVVRERGPARAATSLDPDSPPPVTKLGTVVWSGFVPGSRTLAAELTLDAGLEAQRLPLAVALTFTPAGGGPSVQVPLGGALPGPGAVQVTVTTAATAPTPVPLATLAAADMAPLLDTLRAAALSPGPKPPVAGGELPATVAGTTTGTAELDVGLPMRLTGSITAGPTASLQGPGTTPSAGGGTVQGVLDGTVSFTLDAPDGGDLALDLTAVPTLDPRTLTPPAGAASWSDWAAGSPSQDEVDAANAALITATATTARLATLSPYLGADLPGVTSTAFGYVLADAEPDADRPVGPTPDAGRIALVALALTLLAGTGVGIWRQL